MQKFVVKKSKSAPIAPTSSQPSQPSPQLAVVSSAEKTVPQNAPTAKLNSAESTAVCKSDVTTTKQTAIKSASPSPAPPPTPAPAQAPPAVSHVKMSGYLKKKRNKMGGWRKLWFVLQNQLLLSYSSKEDYEKKLAPFKDVLNLVPGTVVRPTKGPRFTIETSTNLIYTYRCDNNKECSEWITALVESLGLQSADYKHASKKLHFSMENLSKTRASSSSSSSASTSPASSFMSSRSCDSIYRSQQKPKINPKLPVAENTARILERAQSVNTKPNKNGTNTKKEAASPTRVHNFRLHPNEAHGNQSFEVHQINRMFSTSSSASPTKSNSNNIISRNATKCAINANGNLVNSPRKLARNEHSRRRHHHHHHHQHQHHHHRIKETNEMSTDSPICAFNNLKTENNCLDKNSNRHSITIMDSILPTHRTENGNCALVEQIQRISLENDKNSNLHASCVRKTSATSSIASPSLSSSSSVSSGVSNASTASASKIQLLAAPKDQCSRQNFRMEDATNSTTDSNQFHESNKSEPIYAVVNMRDKYENRAKKKSFDGEHPVMSPIQRRERPNSFHVVSADYEEVLQLAVDCVDGCDDDENIYEPINIPELSTKGPLWRYFSKINIDTLVEMSRWKKEERSNGKDEASNTFADLRKRFGQHRKSIKNRMKKLYSRNSYDDDDKMHSHSNGGGNGIEINHMNGHDACGSSSTEPPDENHRIGPKAEGLSAYFNKRDRHLFSSMLKKSRTSLTFDDLSRKKIIGLAAIGGRNGIKNKPTPNLEKSGCHSKFYD